MITRLVILIVSKQRNISILSYGLCAMDVKQRIDKLRMDKGWTLSKLATEIGVSDTTVYAWFNEQNYQPSRKTIEEICDVFEITLAEFYSEIDLDKATAQEVVLLEAFRAVPDEQKAQVIEIVKSFQRNNLRNGE